MKDVRWRPAAALLCLMALTVPAGRAAELTPEKVTAARPELEKLAQQALEKTGVPGMAIGVVYQDQVVYLKGFGVRQVGTAAAVDADTVFQLASVSKPMASTVLARLVGEGVIGWDDRVIDHDPDFRLYDPWVTREVTLRDLLCHRTGLPGQEGDLLEDLGYSGPEILRRLRYVKPDSSFRSHYAYDNFTYTEAGVAGARAAGKSWEDLCVEKLYRPLGMSSTSSRVADYRSAANRAVLHVTQFSPEVVTRCGRLLPEEQADGGKPLETGIVSLLQEVHHHEPVYHIADPPSRYAPGHSRRLGREVACFGPVRPHPGSRPGPPENRALHSHRETV